MIIISTSLETKEVSTKQMKNSKKYFIPDYQKQKCPTIAKILENMKWQDELLLAGV